jgi:hypothetical protein
LEVCHHRGIELMVRLIARRASFQESLGADRNRTEKYDDNQRHDDAANARIGILKVNGHGSLCGIGFGSSSAEFADRCLGR